MSAHERANGSYRAAWWLPGAHLQTVWGRVARRGPRVPLRREAWQTPDGDELLLDWMEGPQNAPILVVLHGLEGSSSSLYVHGLLDQARRVGWRGVALNFRSCARPLRESDGSFIMNRGERLYHSGETSDLAWVVERLATLAPGTPIGLVGVSLGGNVLLKWLGEVGPASPDVVAAAATISVPYDLAAASRHLMDGVGPLYVRYFLRTLKQKALIVAEQHPDLVDADAVRAASSFWEIDDAAVAPIHGFADAADYYARSSSIDYVGRIVVPTRLISAADDPFLPPVILDEVRARASGAVECVFTDRGGHTGFVAGTPLAPRYWAEEEAVAFLSQRVAEV